MPASASPADKAEHGHLVEHARTLVRDAIVDGRFAAGAITTQAEIAHVLGLSRTPLREAIRVLQGEGLVVSQANRKVEIAGFSSDDLQGLYAVRTIHEAAAVRVTVPRLDPEEIGELRALVAKLDHFASEQDYDRYTVPHRQFHALLISRQGARAAAWSTQLFDHSERYRRAYMISTPHSFEKPMHEHHAVLAAAVDRDGSRCARELVFHYLRAADSVLKQLDPQADLTQLQSACAVALAEPDFDAGAAMWREAERANVEP